MQACARGLVPDSGGRGGGRRSRPQEVGEAEAKQAEAADLDQLAPRDPVAQSPARWFEKMQHRC